MANTTGLYHLLTLWTWSPFTSCGDLPNPVSVCLEIIVCPFLFCEGFMGPLGTVHESIVYSSEFRRRWYIYSPKPKGPRTPTSLAGKRQFSQSKEFFPHAYWISLLNHQPAADILSKVLACVMTVNRRPLPKSLPSPLPSFSRRKYITLTADVYPSWYHLCNSTGILQLFWFFNSWLL